MSKTQIILFIYYKMKNNGSVEIDEVLQKFQISVRTFRRYISEINFFCYNNFLDEEVVYDHFNKVYHLAKR